MRASIPLFGLLSLLCTTGAVAQTYKVQVEESGVPFPTIYTKRFNWRYFGELRHTTKVASSSDPKACGESPCLDDGEPGDKGPDGTRGGTASGSILGALPGLYKVELKARRSENRATEVPWSVTSDAPANNQRAGILDLRHDEAISTSPSGSWFVVAGTDTVPIDVQSSISFSFGADDGLDGSLSYGGLRITRVGGAPIPPGLCEAIAKTPSFELCAQTGTTCAGVFTNGAGCVAYCAAAGLLCAERFGGAPGCVKEPGPALPCEPDAPHQSDWCECVAPPPPPDPPDDGPAPDVVSPATPEPGPPETEPDAAGPPPAPDEGPAPPLPAPDAGTPSAGADASPPDSSGLPLGPPADASTPPPLAPTPEPSDGGCGAGGHPASALPHWLPLLLIAGVLARRIRSAAHFGHLAARGGDPLATHGEHGRFPTPDGGDRMLRHLCRGLLARLGRRARLERKRLSS